ncbi:G2 and S phase-expressed protein 1 isoform X2 [Syngnathus scovelli]|uniref:G2 and S phase-expressed protein 1 isoform X2 n=1 Tax=Syngnathus scovelli TaxID=161590 RepID=UPI0021101C44|nr:G2 and S phase-expressed protein 1 isoform X2 [Syngnathus scovelli]
MERRAGSDAIYLLDEKFDFDVSLSPDGSWCAEGEDDVFVDPSRHPVKRSPNNFESRSEQGTCWSPLSGDQLDAVCQEAKRLAEQLRRGKRLHGQDGEDGEQFIQDGAAKLHLLAAPPSLCSPAVRQTFLVQDSPMKDLPPAIRQRLKQGNAPPATRLSARLNASGPTGVKTRAALRGKAGLGALLPSKPAVPRTSSSAAAQKARVQAPGKVASSPDLSGRPKSREDIATDSARVASDVSDLPLDCSTLGKKRTLAAPAKVTRRQSGTKVTPLKSRNPVEGRKTSSSSSSVSSFNSSLSPSPATGKLNSSQDRALTSSTVPANQNKRRSGVVTASPSLASSAAARRCTLPGRARKLSESAKAGGVTPQRQTASAKRTLDKTSAQWIQNGLKAKITAAAPGFCSPDVSKVLKPERRTPMATMDSLHQKAWSGSVTPPAGPSGPLQFRSQRPSGLPTPLKRRGSAIPGPTPGSHSRTSGPPRTQAASARPPGTCFSPTPRDWNMAAEPVVVQAFCLEEEEEPPAASGQSERTASAEPAGRGQSDELQPESAQQEVLLLDLPTPLLPTHEKALIDLINTPDLIGNSTKSCAATQLIDLSSPLIKWSPEDKKENTATLINLSF